MKENSHKGRYTRLALVGFFILTSCDTQSENCGVGKLNTLQGGRSFGFSLEEGRTNIMTLQGVGPGSNGSGAAMITGLEDPAGIVKVGDELILNVNGTRIAVGCVNSINPQENSINTVIYPQARELPEVTPEGE